MAKQQHTTVTSGGTSAGAAAARAVEKIAEPAIEIDPVTESRVSDSTPGPEQIARLAYSYWQARGCPEGSPEEDWFRAEAALATSSVGTEP